MSYNLGAQHFFGDENQGHEICYDRIYSGYTLKHCELFSLCITKWSASAEWEENDDEPRGQDEEASEGTAI